MRNILAVFSSRNQAMQLSTSIKKMGIRNKTINTPRELGEACSLSVVFLEKDILQVKYILSKGNYSSCKGLYIMTGDFVRKYLPV